MEVLKVNEDGKGFTKCGAPGSGGGRDKSDLRRSGDGCNAGNPVPINQLGTGLVAATCDVTHPRPYGKCIRPYQQ